MRRNEHIHVTEAERGPTIPLERLDHDAFVDLAAAVLAKAREDLTTRDHWRSARHFLLVEFPETIWSQYVTVNSQQLTAFVAAECRRPRRARG